jgi:hypothetical protein
MKDPSLKRRDKKCNYRLLSEKEVEAVDPHAVKGAGGSKRDLRVCTGSCNDVGDIVDCPKLRRPDKDGHMTRPRAKTANCEPTGLNINDEDIQKKLKAPSKITSSQIMINLVVSGFSGEPQDLLDELGINFCRSHWRTGEPRGPGLSIKHKNNGFRISPNTRSLVFETRIMNVLKRIQPFARRLPLILGSYSAELSIGAYIVKDDVPPLYLPAKAITILNELNAEVDFDLYFLSGGA